MIQFSITQLEYLVAVDNHRHFARAAEASFVTQPTLSMQLRKLEETLGVTLFDRSKQPVIPTEAGKIVIEHARNILQEASQVTASLEALHGKIGGELKLGIIPTLSPYLLPRFIGSLSHKYPSLQVSVQEMLTEEIVEALQSDRLDAAILVTPLDERGILERPLFYEGILVYGNPEDLPPNEEVNLSKLTETRLWMLASGHCFRNQVVNLCAANQERPEGLKFESGSLETLIRMAEKEGGFTLIPELAAESIRPAQHEHIRQIGGPRPLREVSLVHSRHYAKSHLLKVLEEEIIFSVPRRMLEKGDGTVVAWR